MDAHGHVLATRISQLCAAPAGCAFLLQVEANALSPAQVTAPEVAQTLAAHAMLAIETTLPDHAAAISHILAQGTRLAPLARTLLSHPGAGRWWAPLDLAAQLWVGTAGSRLDLATLVTTVAPPTNLEQHAQWMIGGLATSTIVGSLSAELIAMREGAIDYPMPPPFTRYRLRAAADVRVFAITDALAWHTLCTRYPADLPSGQVVPDWRVVAQDWDAVHLTLGGVLTAEQVTVRDGARWTALSGWGWEQTLWLRDRFTEVEQWDTLGHRPSPPFDFARWEYEGPDAASFEQPWRVWLARDRSEPGDN